MKPVPISTAKEIARKHGFDGVAIIYFKGDAFGATSYGADQQKCKEMGAWIDALATKLESGEMAAPFEAGCPWPAYTLDD